MVIDQHPSPTFLTPQTRAELDKSLDDIEELLLDDEEQIHQDEDAERISSDITTDQPQPSSVAAAAAATASSMPNNMKSMSASASPITTPASSPQSTPQTYYTSWNAVHMEVQENAKLPTFNLPVNRSNSTSGIKVPAPRGRRTMGPKRPRNYSGGNSGVSGGGVVIAGSAAATAVSNLPTNVSNHYNELNFPASPIPKLKHNTSLSSTDQALMDTATSEAIDEMIRLNENDMNLSELFLDGDDRSSAALAYSGSSGRYHPFGIPSIPSVNSLEGSTTNENGTESDASSGGGKNNIHAALAPRPGIAPPQRHLPYPRAKPLPIPVLKAHSPPKPQKNTNENDLSQQTLAEAVATAASIATAASPVSETATAAALSVQPPKVMNKAPMAPPPTGAPSMSSPHKVMVPPPPPPSRVGIPSHNLAPPHRKPPMPGLMPPPPNAASKVPSQVGYSTGPRQYRPPIPTSTATPRSTNLMKPPPAALHAAAHAKTKASLVYASAQHSKFGFGGDHRVVGTPAPPPSAKGFPQHALRTMPNNHIGNSAIIPMSYKGKLGAMPPSTSKLSPDKSNGSKSAPSKPEDEAYERKKQRAKEARKQLNEAIEELAVAIDLAGSQSKERYCHLINTQQTEMIAAAPTSSGATGPAPIWSSSELSALAVLMEGTFNEAQTAKKWDRPSFVGLSASVIHGLNAQCEGLMRELFELKKEQQLWREGGAVSVDAVLSSTDLATPAQSDPVDTQQNDESEPAAKKQKIGECIEATDVHDTIKAEEERCRLTRGVAESPVILKHIASFLDPPSMCRCLCVSKHWISLNVFQNQETWLGLCVQRFGATAVRKWEGDEDDDEETNESSISPSMDLYCRMAEKNVKPYCSLEGSVILGGSSLDGLVGGWVSLVERSNGETSRSVLLSQIHEGVTQTFYTPIPVVELRILVQNTGYSNGSIFIPDQHFSVDASTRRKGEKMLEVSSDGRFKRRVLHIEKKSSQIEPTFQRKSFGSQEMCHLRMFESAVLSVHLHARGCSTTSKFCHRAKKIQILVSVNGTTRPLVIPFNTMTGQR